MGKCKEHDPSNKLITILITTVNTPNRLLPFSVPKAKLVRKIIRLTKYRTESERDTNRLTDTDS